MFSQLYWKRALYTSSRISPSYRRYCSKQVENKGVMIHQTVLETYDFAGSLKPFCVQDFSLQNILALGNPRLLAEVHLSRNDSDNVVSMFQNLSANVQESPKDVQAS